MRILLANKFWYRRGGTEEVVFLTKELLEAAGHEVVIFGMQDPKNELQTKYFSEPVSFEQVSVKNIWRVIYNREAKKKFKELLADFKPEVIHFHNIYHQLSFSLIEAGKEAGVPMVMTIHDYHWLSPNYRLFHHGQIDPQIKLGFWGNVMTNPWENFGKSLVGAFEFAERSKAKYQTAINTFIFPSEFAAQLHTKIGLKEKSAVIPNPVSEKPKKWTNGKYVLYLGRLSPEKGLKTLLAAATLVPDVPFVIAGSGPEQANLEKIITRQKLANVKLVGQVSGAEREQILTEARVVVLPSEWYENAPMSLVEAGAFGKVVLGSNLGGMPEELPDDWCVPAGDAKMWAEKITDWFNRPATERETRGTDFSGQILAKHDPKVYLENLIKTYNSSLSTFRG